MTARLVVRVHPGARDAGLAGVMADGTLKLRVREPAEGGRANRAVEELLAELLKVRSADVAVVRGGSSRGKVIEVRGLEQHALEARLAAALESVGSGEGKRGPRVNPGSRTKHGE